MLDLPHYAKNGASIIDVGLCYCDILKRTHVGSDLTQQIKNSVCGFFR